VVKNLHEADLEEILKQYPRQILQKANPEKQKAKAILGNKGLKTEKAAFLFGKTKVDFAKRDVENRKQDFLSGKSIL
jgi:hypothetical protein